jgi:tetratricopeptide (TPR) repeat protein
MVRLGLVVTGFLAAHAAAAAAGGAAWGLHFLRYLDPARIAAAAALAALVGVVTARPPRLPAPAGTALLTLAFAALGWGLRDRSHLLGDGTVILDPANAVRVFSQRQPGAHLIDVALHDAAARLGAAPARVFEAWSVLCGVALVLLLARTDRRLAAGGWALALAATTGAMQLGFGYVEHYPALAVAWVAGLVALTPAFARPAPLWPGLAALVAALFLHVSTVTLAPAAAWAVARQWTLRRGRTRLVPIAEVAAVAAAAALAWPAMFGGLDGAPSLAGYLRILGRAGRFVDPAVDPTAVAPRLFSAERAADFAQLQLLLAPVALPLAIAGAIRAWRRRRITPEAAGWGVAAASCLGAQALFSPALGAPRDWDVLAAGAFPLAAFAAALTRDAFGPRARGVLVALAAFHTLAWISVNANPAAADARFAELPLSAGQNDFVLGTRALKQGRADEAATHFERVVRDLPDTCPGWFSLGLAHEAAGRAGAARDAFARALSLSARDSRVPRSEILERLGRAAFAAGRTEEAREAYAAAHALRPDSLPPVVFLAVLASREGRPADALELLDPFLPRRAEQPSILMLTADALDALGRTGEADARRAEAARLFPDHPDVRAALARRPVEANR